MDKIKIICRDIIALIVKNDIFSQSSIIAFAAFFSIFPALFFLSTVLGLFAQKYMLYDNLMITIAKFIPPQIFSIITTHVNSILPSKSYLAFLIGLLLALISGTNAFDVAIKYMNRLNDIADNRSYIKKRLLSISFLINLLISVEICIVLILVMNFILKKMLIFSIGENLGPLMIDSGEILIYFLIITLNISFIYKKGLNISLSFADTLRGSVFFASGFLVLNKLLQILFMVVSSMNKTYGVISALIFFIVLLKINAFIFIVGSLIINRGVSSRQTN